MPDGQVLLYRPLPAELVSAPEARSPNHGVGEPVRPGAALFPAGRQLPLAEVAVIRILPEVSLSSMAKPIRDMRNLGPRCEEMLAAIGIHDEGQLRRVGAATAYRELVAAGLTRHHRMLLYALGGAIADLDCLRLPADLKRELEDEAGVPRRKNQ